MVLVGKVLERNDGFLCCVYAFDCHIRTGCNACSIISPSFMQLSHALCILHALHCTCTVCLYIGYLSDDYRFWSLGLGVAS